MLRVPDGGKELEMQLHLNREICSGHGRCYTVAPSLFQDDDEGYGHLKVEDVPAELKDEAELALASCPEGAITAQRPPS